MYGKASHFLKRLHNKTNFTDCWKYNIYDTFKNYFLCECIANDWAFHFLVNSLKSISPKYMYMKHVWYVLGDPVTDQRWNICHVQLVKNSRYLSTSRICTLSCLYWSFEGCTHLHLSQEKERYIFFSAFYFAINLGSMLSIILTPILRGLYQNNFLDSE